MSFSLAVVDGDLVQAGDQLAIVSGADKLKQDLRLWVMERAGIDRFHPTFGSSLEDSIGGVIDNNTSQEAVSELMRVLQNYAALQTATLKQKPQTLSLSEMLMNITSVTATVSYDTVTAKIIVANGDQQQVTTTLSTSTMGT